MRWAKLAQSRNNQVILPMDSITLLYYAAVCAVLSAYAPRLGRAPVRFVIGAIVGIAAAAILPVVRTLL